MLSSNINIDNTILLKELCDISNAWFRCDIYLTHKGAIFTTNRKYSDDKAECKNGRSFVKLCVSNIRYKLLYFTKKSVVNRCFFVWYSNLWSI